MEQLTRNKTIQQIVTLLGRWDRRLRVQQSITWLPRGLMVGVALGIVLAIIARLRPWLLPEQLTLVTVMAALVGAVGALLIIWLARRDALVMAQRFDSLFGLKERVSTALELASGGIRAPNEEINQRQLEDTITRAQQIDPRGYLPLRLARRDLVLLAVLVLAFAALLLIENPQAQAVAEQQLLEGAIQEQVEDLEAIREQITDDENLTDEMREELLEALDEAIETLEQDDLSREEAVATLSDLQQEMQDIAEQPEIDPAEQEALQEAAERLSEQAEQLADALQEGNLEETAEALGEMAEQLGEMGQAQQQDLGEALQEAADALSEANPELAESLQEAADALQEGNIQQAEEALSEASDQLNEQQEMAESSADAGQQYATDTAQQASTSAQRIAQSGEGTSFSDQAAQAPQGDTTSPISQEGEGAQNAPGEGNSQSGSGEGDESTQTGEGTGEGGQGSAETQAEEGGMAGGAGEGSSPGEEGGFMPSGEQVPTDNNPDGTGESEYEPIYAPQRIGDQEGNDVQIEGSDQPGDIVTEEGDLTEQNPGGEATIGYDEVYSDYANAANQALESDYIPLNLRDVVHDYFAALEPD